MSKQPTPAPETFYLYLQISNQKHIRILKQMLISSIFWFQIIVKRQKSQLYLCLSIELCVISQPAEIQQKWKYSGGDHCLGSFQCLSGISFRFVSITTAGWLLIYAQFSNCQMKSGSADSGNVEIMYAGCLLACDNYFPVSHLYLQR